ncbi:MAG: response regulator transcription factor [Acidobacteriales bacterium]|nr:response regulator transcription factor [Terriglobales bacterium]
MVVDDEPLARSSVTLLLREDPDIQIVGECGSGEEAVSHVRALRPDLLFLDVQMPECDGFDVLEMLGAQVPTAVVFVTAYDQYALRAFEAGALDYLLKPFDDERFRLALRRAKQRAGQAGSSSPKLDHLVIKSVGEVVFLKTAEIDWIEAADYYACVHVGPRTHLLRRSLADLDDELDPAAFCRIHRSAIVNLERVSGLKLNEDGEHEVVLRGGTRLRLSRRYRKQLQERMEKRISRRTESPRVPPA